MTNTAIRKLERTVRFGTQQVPLYKAAWRRAPDQPYRKTFEMKPGDFWFDMEATKKYSRIYALDDSDRAVLPEALVAQHLKNEGAKTAFFIELWGGNIVAVNENLICEDWETCAVGPIIREYTVQSDRPGAGGFPNVVAVFPDGRIAFRKVQRANYSIQPNQHEAANLLRRTHGGHTDLAVVRWQPQ